VIDVVSGQEDYRLLATDGKSAAAVMLGRRGGLKGGKARAAKLSAEERSSIARRAANARWSVKMDPAND